MPETELQLFERNPNNASLIGDVVEHNGTPLQTWTKISTRGKFQYLTEGTETLMLGTTYNQRSKLC